MINLSRGANTALTATSFTLTCTWPTAAGQLDCSAFLLTSQGKVRGDRDMIFYNQLSAQNDCLEIQTLSPNSAVFLVRVLVVPDDIEKILICLTSDVEHVTLASYPGTEVRIEAGAGTLVRYEPALEGADELALITVELYRRAGSWKVRAVGQGFRGGLGALARSLGVDVDEATEPGAPQTDIDPATTPPTDAVEIVPATAEPDRAGEDFSSLAPAKHRSAPTPRTPRARLLDLEQPPEPLILPDTPGPVAITLNWTCQIGGADGRIRPIVLGLGAFYRLATGETGIIQAKNNRGDSKAPPWLALKGVAENRREGGQDILEINGDRLQAFDRIDVFAHIVQGSASWAGCAAWCTLRLSAQPPFELALPPGPDGAAVVALLSLSPRATSLTILPQARYASNQAELDEAFGWGLDWRFERPG